MAEVVVGEKSDYVANGESPFDGHYLGTFGGERIVEGDGDLDFGEVEERAKFLNFADRANSDAFGAPSHTPWSSEDFDCAENR